MTLSLLDTALVIIKNTKVKVDDIWSQILKHCIMLVSTLAALES